MARATNKELFEHPGTVPAGVKAAADLVKSAHPYCTILSGKQEKNGHFTVQMGYYDDNKVLHVIDVTVGAELALSIVGSVERSDAGPVETEEAAPDTPAKKKAKHK